MHNRIVTCLLLATIIVSVSILHASSLLVQCEVSEARVLLDNRDLGETDQQGVAFINGISPGSHRLTISREGYETYSEDLIVKEKLTTIVEITLTVLKLDQTPPDIKLLSPELTGEIRLSSREESIQIIGLARDESGVSSVSINGQRAELSSPTNEEMQLFPGKTVKFISEVSLSVSSNTILIEAADSVGNRYSGEEVILGTLTDRTPPDIKLLSPEPTGEIRLSSREESIQVIGLARDESGVSSVSINGQRAELSSPTNEEMELFPGKTVKFISEVSLSISSNTIQIEAADNVGNLYSGEEVTLGTLTDRTPPEIRLLSPDSTGEIGLSSREESIQIIGLARDESGIFSVSINGQRAELSSPTDEEMGLFPGKTVKFISEVSLSVGSNTLQIEAADRVGNLYSGVEVTLATLTDQTPPEIRLLSPDPTVAIRIASRAEFIQIIGLARDESGVSSVSINGQKAEFSPATNEETELLPGKTDMFIVYVPVMIGNNTFRIEAIDGLGNRYSGVRTGNAILDRTPPDIMLLSPEPTRGIRITSKEESFQIIGLARDEAGVASVSVNGQNVELSDPSIDEENLFPGKTIKFMAEVFLTKGANRILIEAVDKVGNKKPLEQIIEREEDLLASLNITFRALLIGIQDYEHWGKLGNPVYDVKALNRELIESYGFNTVLLRDASRSEILTCIRSYYKQKFDENDELLIVLSGHGHFDEQSRTGYFVARDGEKPSDDPNFETYIGYPILQNLITNIPCKHILVVIDACFGGTFFQEIALRGEEDLYMELPPKEKILRKLKFKTRMMITSGGKEYVPDGRLGHHSPFMRKFLEGLRNYGGSDRILGTDELKVMYMDGVDPQPFMLEFGDNEPGSNFLFIAK
jgi:Caspase domain/PEGA domain